MARDDDEARQRAAIRHEIGQDLSALSVHEIDDRIEALRAEIARLEADRSRKEASRIAAGAFFKS